VTIATYLAMRRWPEMAGAVAFKVAAALAVAAVLWG
jgi:hypothetical protein